MWQKLERKANKQANMDAICCMAYVTVLLKPTLQLPGVSFFTNPVSLDLPALASKSATASLLDIKNDMSFLGQHLHWVSSSKLLTELQNPFAWGAVTSSHTPLING